LSATNLTMTAGVSGTTLGSGPIKIAHGTPVYFHVGINPSAATGAISLVYSNANGTGGSIASAAVSAGTAAFSTSALPGGTYTVYAEYGGDTNYAQAKSLGIPITVTTESSLLSTTLSVYDAQTGNPKTAMTYGSYFFADVVPYGSTEGISAGNPATGTVTLSLDGTQVAIENLNAEGGISYQIKSSSLTPGTHTLLASYSGDASYGPSSSSLPISIQSSAPANFSIVPATGTAWTLSETNTGVGVGFSVYSLGVAPSGTVTFTMNGQTLGTSTIWSQAGTTNEYVSGATYAVSPSQIGAGKSATFTATYSGDTNYSSAGSQSTTITVVGAGLSLSAGGNLTMSAGASASEAITVTPTGGLTGAVTLTCALTSSNSTGPSCTIPGTVTISGTSAQIATATISTTSVANISPERRGIFSGLGGGAAVLCIIVFAPRRRRWARSGLFAFMLLAVFTALSACSGGSNTTTGTGGSGSTPTSTTYTYTVTAAQGSLIASTHFNVTVTSN